MVLVAVFCKDDAPTAENYVNKSCSKKCQIYKKMMGEIATLNHVILENY